MGVTNTFLTWRGYKMKTAVGVSATLGVPIALAGTISYIYNGIGVSGLPEYSLGFVYLPAVAGVVLTSSFFARLVRSFPISYRKIK